MTQTPRRPTHARGFLFADLRGYTAFVEARGNDAAAELLRSYRIALREVIARFDGAEIRTEGDSFYVVFPSASDAILAGLAILDEAVGTPEGGPVGVGVGVHAGEATETDEGYVGWAVNVAARLCALAGRGELLVSETARIITHGQLDVRFTPRGRKRLKGIAEQVPVYLVTASAEPAPKRSVGASLRTLRGRRLDRLAMPLALAAGVLILTAGAIAFIGPSLYGAVLTLGGLRCDLGGAAPDVAYYWQAVHETGFAFPGSDVAFSTIVGERNLPRGDCATDTRAWGTWEFGANSGELLCSAFGGDALIAWTYDGEPIIALAEREDGDSERLYRWWLDHARVFGPEPSS